MIDYICLYCDRIEKSLEDIRKKHKKCRKSKEAGK